MLSRAVFLGKLEYALPNRLINQFKSVQPSRQQELRAYCPTIYTVKKLKEKETTNQRGYLLRKLALNSFGSS